MRNLIHRATLPFFLAALFIAGLEGAIALVGNNGSYNTDFFDFSPLEQDNLQKHTIYDKFETTLTNIPSEVVQVGDSSGFYGVDPKVVTKVADRLSYLNMSCCGDAGWTGYFYEAQLAIMRQATPPKFLVLHVTPFWSPAAPAFYGDNALAVLIRDYLIKAHWWHQVRMPSEGYRLRVTNLVYHDIWVDDFTYQLHQWPTLGYPPIKEWRRMIAAGRGWVPIPVDIKDPMIKGGNPGVCKFDRGYSENELLGLVHIDTLYDYLSRFAELARRTKTRFVLVSNPVPCVVEQDAVFDDVERQIARFKRDYPEAVVPFRYFRQAPLNDFSDRWHLKEDGVVEHSARIGAALAAAASTN
ncbi:hypothetical protein SAMN02745126_05074 [Enhydrobacter aerosaccus]|uniref:Uncharacterized protein n=1 Tax=Enhydrobacter aerosaccus TaxID=225324 RepID=A0A1T4SRV7_9HYPH|nr:hypothetical protein [Enhydrobacter aerosaccus]SKA31030.1 hypothetical protein SAMN02745126_05074 [Enhydrobacter aerosaccus]